MDLKRDSVRRGRPQISADGGGSAAFLAFGMALLLCAAGTLSEGCNLPELAPAEPLALAGWGFVLIGIAFKLSLVPAHLWTPDVYQGAPAPVVAFLSGRVKSGDGFVACSCCGCCR